MIYRYLCDRFMNAEKNVAIISEAASSGISLQVGQHLTLCCWARQLLLSQLSGHIIWREYMKTYSFPPIDKHILHTTRYFCTVFCNSQQNLFSLFFSQLAYFIMFSFTRRIEGWRTRSDASTWPWSCPGQLTEPYSSSAEHTGQSQAYLPEIIVVIKATPPGLWISIYFCGSGSSCFSRCGSGSSFTKLRCDFKLRRELSYEEFAVNDPTSVKVATIGFLLRAPMVNLPNFLYSSQ